MITSARAALIAVAVPLSAFAGAAPEPNPAPVFHVKVELSKTAAASLATIKETIMVVAYYYGLPAKGQENKADEMGQIQLGQEDVELPGAGTATFSGAPIKTARLPYIDGGVQVVINVFSGRKSSPNNLLDCGFFDGPVAQAAKKGLSLYCKMIAEQRQAAKN